MTEEPEQPETVPDRQAWDDAPQLWQARQQLIRWANTDDSLISLRGGRTQLPCLMFTPDELGDSLRMGDHGPIMDMKTIQAYAILKSDSVCRHNIIARFGQYAAAHEMLDDEGLKVLNQNGLGVEEDQGHPGLRSLRDGTSGIFVTNHEEAKIMRAGVPFPTSSGQAKQERQAFLGRLQRAQYNFGNWCLEGHDQHFYREGGMASIRLYSIYHPRELSDLFIMRRNKPVFDLQHLRLPDDDPVLAHNTLAGIASYMASKDLINPEDVPMLARNGLRLVTLGDGSMRIVSHLPGGSPYVHNREVLDYLRHGGPGGSRPDMEEPRELLLQELMLNTTRRSSAIDSRLAGEAAHDAQLEHNLPNDSFHAPHVSISQPEEEVKAGTAWSYGRNSSGYGYEWGIDAPLHHSVETAIIRAERQDKSGWNAPNRDPDQTEVTVFDRAISHSDPDDRVFRGLRRVPYTYTPREPAPEEPVALPAPETTDERVTNDPGHLIRWLRRKRGNDYVVDGKQAQEPDTKSPGKRITLKSLDALGEHRWRFGSSPENKDHSR